MRRPLALAVAVAVAIGALLMVPASAATRHEPDAPGTAARPEAAPVPVAGASGGITRVPALGKVHPPVLHVGAAALLIVPAANRPQATPVSAAGGSAFARGPAPAPAWRGVALPPPVPGVDGVYGGAVPAAGGGAFARGPAPTPATPSKTAASASGGAAARPPSPAPAPARHGAALPPPVPGTMGKTEPSDLGNIDRDDGGAAPGEQRSLWLCTATALLAAAVI